MKMKVLNQIEESVKTLSIEEQLFIIERIAYIIREKTFNEGMIRDQLKAMACDIEIQKELNNINNEFSHTELDGLENY
jgi:hypothetical protein